MKTIGVEISTTRDIISLPVTYTSGNSTGADVLSLGTEYCPGVSTHFQERKNNRPLEEILDRLSGIQTGRDTIVGEHIGGDFDEDVVGGKHAKDTR